MEHARYAPLYLSRSISQLLGRGGGCEKLQLQNHLDVPQALGRVPASEPLECFRVTALDSTKSVTEVPSDGWVDCCLTDDFKRLNRVSETVGVSLCGLC